MYKIILYAFVSNGAIALIVNSIILQLFYKSLFHIIDIYTNVNKLKIKNCLQKKENVILYIQVIKRIYGEI